MAFVNEAACEKPWRLCVKDWAFSKTRISENHSYEDFRRDKPADAMEVLIMNEDKALEFRSLQRSNEPESGNAII
jgi:hypothetical protein